MAGVRALEQGDYGIRCMCGAETKLRRLRGAFDRMRNESAKNATGVAGCRTPGDDRAGWQVPLSHDLRHSLAAIMANAEFLCEGNLTSGQREDLYAEIRIAVNQMTDLIESLLEYSRTRESLHPSLR